MRNIWYPVIPARRLAVMAGIAVLGAAAAGAYGCLHDQVSYTISPEYFTRLKFAQFASADFGWPPRVFVAEIGVLATWWVGLIAGWILARAGLAELAQSQGRKPIRNAFAIAAGVAVVVGVVGALLGAARTRGDVRAWNEWQERLDVQDLRGFVIVAHLHVASYLGAAAGLVAAVVYVRRNLARRERDHAIGDTHKGDTIGA